MGNAAFPIMSGSVPNWLGKGIPFQVRAEESYNIFYQLPAEAKMALFAAKMRSMTAFVSVPDASKDALIILAGDAGSWVSYTASSRLITVENQSTRREVAICGLYL